ncbi:uncharacterized protein E5676_scaffold675G00530 [Cucumis melo var. makuwa]|uniref:Transmembrane protein n=1 Tax=Cucumis melo var. makuwa TaxID=1194695 RepID=A0A5A7U717_CUCMM|nr:uncharacterized protein E6C27_scaffold2606G00030 [Cucumis melo var. makuwa]TYK04377.1 uncharacterized protein E5676_scaffold675G00530 [Cucumis melo var. makuwa]
MRFVLGYLEVDYLGFPLLFGRLFVVCYNLQVYWASVFVFLTGVLHEVDRILRLYLWRGKREGIKLLGGRCSPFLKRVILLFVMGCLGILWAILWQRDRLKYHVHLERASRRFGCWSSLAWTRRWLMVFKELRDVWERVWVVRQNLSVEDRWVGCRVVRGPRISWLGGIPQFCRLVGGY